jgi:hypothetical protein
LEMVVDTTILRELFVFPFRVEERMFDATKKKKNRYFDAFGKVVGE